MRHGLHSSAATWGNMVVVVVVVVTVYGGVAVVVVVVLSAVVVVIVVIEQVTIWAGGNYGLGVQLLSKGKKRQDKGAAMYSSWR